MKNIVASMLKVISIVFAIGGVIFVVSTMSSSVFGYSAIVFFTMIPWIFVVSVIIYGFGEIIQLLTDIRSNTSRIKATSGDGFEADNTELPRGNKYSQVEGADVVDYPNGNRYVGDLKEGLRNGRGTMTYSDGTEQTGRWEKDLYKGE